ncbi:MAG: hypothetical protein K940chlam7_01457 [Chlamydiae bacterium]|nr:hypothetical protein [Chlamydiota bacterium]
MSWDYTVITVCIDKRMHKEKYTEWRFEPYHYCLETLLERYLYFLDSVGQRGDVMAESRGGKGGPAAQGCLREAMGEWYPLRQWRALSVTVHQQTAQDQSKIE